MLKSSLTESQEVKIRTILLREIREVIEKASEVIKLDHKEKENAIREKIDMIYLDIDKVLN